MSTEKHCRYELPDRLRGDDVTSTEWRCTEQSLYPVQLIGEFCIFHYHKPNVGATNPQEFANALLAKGDANYRGFVFPTGFNVRNLSLQKADFTDAHFLDHADFSKGTFEGPTHFDGATFDKSANFKGAKFQGNVSFAQATFHKDASFENASFLGIHPNEATLDELWDSVFGAVNFNRAEFTGPAYFIHSTFEATSSFADAEFSDVVGFGSSSFSEGADAKFSMTKFKYKCFFNDVHSCSKIEFTDCVFSEEADFRNSNFQGSTRFIRDTFSRLARFGGESPNENKESPLNVRFWETDLERVAFRNADLRIVSFYHCHNLDKAEFSACLWNKALNRQRVLYEELTLRGCKPIWGEERSDEDSAVRKARDEIRSDSGEVVADMPRDAEWERVENTYRDLRRNFEDRRDYAGASEFYVGEMEMRRLKRPERQREIFSLEALYLHLSTYGENWWKPLVWLLVLILLSTSVYAGWPTDFSTLVLSLLHSLSVLTLLRVSVAEPLHWSGQLMAILQLVLSPILITLSLLAIRRKLKR